MEQVTSTVADTAKGSLDVAKVATDDIVQLNFYKNPIFIVFMVYLIFIFGVYFNMTDSKKNSYIFSNKFRDEAGDIHWSDIISYPYILSGMVSMLKVVLLSPIILYCLIGIPLTMNIVSPSTKERGRAYLYAVMFGYLVIIVLFTIHMVILNFILDTKTTEIELRIGDADKEPKTYSSFYRTQWILLIAFMPIIMFTVVYIARKGKGVSTT